MTPIRVVFISIYLVCGMTVCLGKHTTHTKCNTKLSNELVNRIQSRMDTTVSPCDHFEQYACGNYKKERANTTWLESVFYDTATTNKMRIKEILESPVQNGVDKPYERKAKIFFQSCMDTDAIEKRGMVDYPTSRRNDWPTLNPTWDKKSFKLQQLFNRYAYRNVLTNVYLNVTLWYDRITVKFMPNSWISKSLFNTSEQEKKYAKFYTDIAVALGAKRKDAKCDARKVVKLMKKVTQIPDSKGPVKPLFVAPAQMNKDYPYIDWVEFINTLSGHATEGVGPDDKVYIVNPEYFKGLGDVLHKADSRAVQNLFGFKYVYDLLRYSTQKMKDIHRNFTQSTKKENRSLFCSEVANHLYDMPILKIEGKIKFTEKSKKFLEEMNTNIKAEQSDSVRNMKWMTNYTKEGILKKIDTVKTLMGASISHFDEDSVEKLYRPFKVCPKKFLKNYLQNLDLINAFNFDHFNKDARVMRFMNDLIYPGGVIMYYPNIITIPMGELQRPLYDQDYPSYWNYGAVGAVLGHELSHMFGGLGRLFNYKGVMGSHWNQTDVEYYNDKSKCYIRQLSEYRRGTSNITVNGEKSYEENLNDHVGLVHAYRAYQKRAANHPEEKPLPRLNLTKDQLFFLSFTQSYCFVGSDKQWASSVNRSHANMDLRGLFAMQNMEEFAKAFNCKKGDYMVPEKRCGILE